MTRRNNQHKVTAKEVRMKNTYNELVSLENGAVFTVNAYGSMARGSEKELVLI